MRCVAGVGLLALVGCNQIFSLAPTREFDAAISIDVIPDVPHVELTWQVASVLPTGGPDPAITFEPIMPAPDVRIATLDGRWESATYSSSDGWILIPHSYVGTTWRLEYTIVDGVTAPVPHEVQWAPEDKLGHLTIPLFGRVARDPLPVDAVYKIRPNNAPVYRNPAVVTTGMWTEGTARLDPGDTTGATVDYAFTRAAPLSGKKARPDPVRGDRAFLIDYIVGTATPSVPDSNEVDCQVAVGAVMLDSSAVQTGIPAAQTPAASWDTRRDPVLAAPLELKHAIRLRDTLGSRNVAVTGSLLVGHAPSLGVPGLAGTRATALPIPPASVRPTVLPIPVMMTLVQCPYSANTQEGHPGTPLPKTIQPSELLAFPRVLHIQLVNSRPVLGIDLPSGMETVIPLGDLAVEIEFPAAMATRPTLRTPSDNTVMLDGDSEQVAVGSTAGTFQLDFTPEAGAGLRADYHDVLLHRLDGPTLITERIYTVTAPTVRIDGSVLRPNSTYVFEIRTYKGHQSAARGDFAPVDYPYGAAIVFTRTFKTP
jgi:hypothetical protein